MKKIGINLVTVGHLPAKFDKSIIKSWHSDVFTIEGDTKISKITKEKVMMLGLCIVNKTKEYASGATPVEALCNKWYLERFPQSYKDV